MIISQFLPILPNVPCPFIFTQVATFLAQSLISSLLDKHDFFLNNYTVHFHGPSHMLFSDGSS